jgi:hypothetical protein
MVIRDRLRRLEAAMEGNLSSIELADGTTYRYNPGEVWRPMLEHAVAATEADYERKVRPQAPEVLRIVCRAKNRRAALSRLYPEWETRPPFCGFDLRALVERGELVHVAFAPGYPPVVEEGEAWGGEA